MTGAEKTLRARIARVANRLGCTADNECPPGTQAEIARQCGCSREYVGQVLGRRGKRSSARGQRPAHKIYAYTREFKAAAKRAHALGRDLLSGENTGKGSVGLLVESIGKGELTVVETAEYENLQRLAALGASLAQTTLDGMGQDDD